MRLPFTLSTYIGRQFFNGIALAFASMLVIIALGDLVELIRRADDTKAGFSTILELLLLKTPSSAMSILPFAVMIGGMVTLTRLTRSNELVIARAAGVSAWQFLTPAIILTLLIGIFFVTIFNPISAVFLSRFEQLEAKSITGKTSLFAISSSGLWIKQVEKNAPQIKERVIHSTKVEQDGTKLAEVVVFNIGANNKFISRIDAASANLEKGNWHLHNISITKPAEQPVKQDDMLIDTDITLAQIQDSFASPVTLSFWQLPSFINTLEKAGFSALHHRMYWHSMLSLPLLLCAMILISAVFSLRLPRRGGIMLLIVAGVAAGFMTHFLTNLVQAFGQSGEIPVILAAWTPATIALLIGVGLLLHFEDG